MEVNREKIADLGPWFHNLHLPGGFQTAPSHPLGDFPKNKWDQISPYLPMDLDGASTLDIGCNAGFYSFELARRGAKVLGIDREELFLNQARWAAEVLELSSQTEFRNMQIYELSMREEKFDIVLFLGVMYHLRYPMLAMDIVSRISSKMLVFQTLTMPGDEVYSCNDLGLFERDKMLKPGWPKMAFIENALAGDETNWWAPNHACVEAMLRGAGMRIIARPGDEIYVAQPDPQRPSALDIWDMEEFLAATGQAHKIKKPTHLEPMEQLPYCLCK